MSADAIISEEVRKDLGYDIIDLLMHTAAESSALFQNRIAGAAPMGQLGRKMLLPVGE